MSDHTASFVGDIPENYDRGLGPVFFTHFAEDMARRVAALSPMRVLETSAGTGIVTRRLRDLLPSETELLATDLNPPMLDIARTKFSPDERVDFQPADATELPFTDQRFDAVVCQFGVMFFPDKAKSYREAHRVLMPGGHYLFSVMDAHRYNPLHRLIHQMLAGLYPDDPPGFYEVPFAYHRIDPIKEAVIEAGFTDFSASVRRIEQPVANMGAFTRGVVFGNPVIEQIRERGGDPDKVVDAVAEMTRYEFGDPPVIPLQAIQFSATR